jgi:integrase
VKPPKRPFGRRHYPVGPATDETIREQKGLWLKKKEKDPDKDWTELGWLFPNEDGGWLDMANVAERDFHRCMEKAGLHRRRHYDLRHSFASLLLTAAAPIAYVSEQTGNQNIQLTAKLYCHLQTGANRHWMNKLPGAKKTKGPKMATRANWKAKMKKAANSGLQVIDSRAGHGIRTRDLDLGNLFIN